MMGMSVLSFWTPGPVEIIIVLLVALVIFGSRLPKIARDIGRSLTSFRKGLREVQDEIETEVEKTDAEKTAKSEVAAAKDDKKDDKKGEEEKAT